MLRLLRNHHHFPAWHTQTTTADRHLWEKIRTWKEKSIAVEHVELHQRFPNYLQTKLKRDQQHFSVFLAASPKEVKLKEKNYFFQSMTVKPGRGEARPVSPHTWLDASAAILKQTCAVRAM